MTTNKMNPKKKYAKPTVKLAKWELNEAICNNVTCLSYRKCIGIQKGTKVSVIEDRSDYTGTWDRVGSR